MVVELVGWAIAVRSRVSSSRPMTSRSALPFLCWGVGWSLLSAGVSSLMVGAFQLSCCRVQWGVGSCHKDNERQDWLITSLGFQHPWFQWFLSNTSHDQQPRPWLYLGQRPTRGPWLQPWPTWHHDPSNSIALMYQHGHSTHPKPLPSVWP